MLLKRRNVVSSVVLGATVLCAVNASAQQESAEEQSVWKLEHAYWEYVKALDLNRYESLWHSDFVGWPSSSAEPVRKDRITDWITVSTDKGLRLKSYTLEPAASQAAGNLVITHYWLTEHWADKDGKGEPDTIKITHTWIRTPKGWQIISGMAAPTTRRAAR